jgi:hypothetical protein
MKKLACLLIVACASPVLAQDFTDTLVVAPGFVEHWRASRPFARVVPGTAEVVEVLSVTGNELVFMVKPDAGATSSTTTTGAFGPFVTASTSASTSLGTTNILLLDDAGRQVANLRIVIPARLNGETRRGPDGWQVYRKDNPDYVPPKKVKQ